MKREEIIKTIEDRYITAHCNPDFKGSKFDYIFAPIKEQPKPDPLQGERNAKPTAEEICNCSGRLDLTMENHVFYCNKCRKRFMP